jgi:STAS-like domain of unknown function (DUF4325)
MVINVLELVPHCYSWADGEVVGHALAEALRSNEKVTISFAGVEDVPSSFVNAAFVSLLPEFGYDRIRDSLSVVRSNRQINDMIRRRLRFENDRGIAAA